jgi:hypothetical protein
MLLPEIQSGSVVRFSLSNVVCPDTEELFEKISGSLEVDGRVIFLSDSGESKDNYAVVEVGGIYSPLIIPIDKIRSFRLPANPVTNSQRE